MTDESGGADAPAESAGSGTAEGDVHGWLAAAELLGLVALFGYVTVGVLGDGGVLASASRPVRVAALAFATVELLIPAWVFLDARRRPEMADTRRMWVHAAAMPVLNVFGLAAYLAERKRKAGERESGDA